MNEPRPQDQGPDQGEKPAQNTPSIEAIIKSSLLITALIMAAIIIAHRAGIIETEMEVLDVMRTTAKMFATLTSSRPVRRGHPHIRVHARCGWKRSGMRVEAAQNRELSLKRAKILNENRQQVGRTEIAVMLRVPIPTQSVDCLRYH